MISILNLLGALLILSFLVIIHEFGHYYAAKRNGIKVPEFGIGFPPKLFKFKRKGTEFCINLIPFGGYVKLHGEDSHDPKLLSDKHSFASKTPWQKIEVLIAGVLMNFLVFWVLMSFALWTGVNPILTSAEDFKQSVKDGYYNLVPDITVEISEDARLSQGDVVTKINGTSDFDAQMVTDLVSGDLEIDSLEVKAKDSFKELLINDKSLNNVDFYPLASVPYWDIKNISEDSVFSGLLEVGDQLFSINNIPVFDLDTFTEELLGSEKVVLGVLRNSESITVEAIKDPQYYFVEQVITGSAAETAGMQVGDKIYAVDGLIMGAETSIPDFIKNKGLATVVFTVERADEVIDLIVNPDENGLIGVMLSSEVRLTDLGIDFVQGTKFGSVIKVKDYRVPLYMAPFEALTQGLKIAKATVIGFVSTVYGVVTNFTVSEQVGGPVQVAKLGYEFVDRGGIELISFIALISLSLAVINLLPIPALDGGRLLFVLIEALRGRPINQRLEAIIHTFGFVFLMGFILVITFFDIARW